MSELMRLVGFNSSAEKVPETEKQAYYYNQQWFKNNAIHRNFMLQCLAAEVLECYTQVS